MPRLSRILATAVVTASLGLVALPANADPTPAPSPPSVATTAPQAAASASRTIKTTLSKSQSEKVLRATLVLHHSARGHLDWRAAKKYFGAHTTWRDDFSAGAVGAGAPLDHASASTKSRLRARWNADGPNPARVSPQRGGTNCTGVTKDVQYTRDRGRSEDWYNSCDTNTMINHYKTCSDVMGFVGILTHNYWSSIPGAIALACYVDGGDMTTAQKNSNVNAVKWFYYHVTRVGGNGMVDGQVYISAKLLPQ